MDTYSSPVSRARHYHHEKPQSPAFQWTLRRSFKITLAISSLPLCLNALSGDWLWPQAWFVTILQILIYFVAAVYIWKHNPSLYIEREQFTSHEGTANFDKVLATSLVALTPLMYFAAGVQHRCSKPWSLNYTVDASQAAAAVLFVLAIVLECWSMACNRWFSSVVRIQTDRGHRVCQSGPYALVRHPGYVAFALQSFGESILLESSWLGVLAVARTVVLLIRTMKEDAWLQRELVGYAEYTRKVEYKWLPFVW